MSVAENEKIGSLNTVNHDVGSDDFHNAVDTRDIIISRVKTRPVESTHATLYVLSILTLKP